MSKTFYLFFFCSLLLVGCSCTNDPQEIVNKKQQGAAPSIGDDYDEMERYEAIDVAWYLSHYDSLFRHPMVFESVEELDAVLDYIQDIDYEELRAWYNQADFYSPTIESNITYDSIWNDVVEQNGMGFDEETISDSIMDLLYDQFTQVMITEHPSACIYHPNTNDYETLTPIGNIGIEAFCNENNLFVVNKVVYRLVAGYFITCPIDKYIYLPRFSNWTEAEVWELQLDIETNAIENVGNEDIIIYKLGQNSSFEQEYTQKRHEETFRNYKLVVEVDAAPAWAWFMQTDIKGFVSINNYYKNKKHRTLTSGRVTFEAKITNPEIDEQYRPFVWLPAKIYGKYRHRQLHTNWTYHSGTRMIRRTTVDVFNISVNVSQIQGATISYN